MGVEARRALRAARGPELLELAAQLLAGRRPVGDDVVAQILDVALQVNFILLEPADVELLSRGATLELPRNVLFVVTDDSIASHCQSRMFSPARPFTSACIGAAHLVMMPVVLTPSVRWVTRNLPAALIG